MNEKRYNELNKIFQENLNAYLNPESVGISEKEMKQFEWLEKKEKSELVKFFEKARKENSDGFEGWF